MNKKDYVSKVLQLYLALPETPSRLNRLDYRLAGELHERGVTQEEIETAMLMAIARRLARNPQAPPLGPIRSLHYFLPVLNEVSSTRVPEGYLQYLVLTQ
jgi:hypothetical protein